MRPTISLLDGRTINESVARYADILASSHVTASVTTGNSIYTVVTRAFGVVLIHPAGRVLGGAKVRIVDGHLVLFAANGGKIWETSTVRDIYIMSN